MVGFLKSTGATLLALVSLAHAQLTSDCALNICVAASVPPTGNDVYLQITAPAKKENLGWVGIGFGSRMKDSLVFIVYPNKAGRELVISPRLATGNVMPERDASIDITILDGTGIAANGDWTANFVCHNCGTWGDGAGALDYDEQPIIWAEGNGQTVLSDNVAAPLSQHGRRGGGLVLNLNAARADLGPNPFMADAESTGTPTPVVPTRAAPDGSRPTNDADADYDEDDKDDTGAAGARWSKHDRMLLAHALLATLPFTLLLPLSASFLRLLSVPAHLAANTFTLLSLLSALVLAILAVSSPDSLTAGKHFSTAHQILGVVLIAWMFTAQPLLGALHHARFRRTQRGSVFGVVHRWAGRGLWVGGVVAAALGIRLAGVGRREEGKRVPRWAVGVFGAVVAVGAVLWAGALVVASRRREGKGVKKEVVERSPAVRGKEEEWRGDERTAMI